MTAIKMKTAQKCLQILWIRPDFPPRQFQASDSCTLLNSGTNLSLRKVWTFYFFILQEWSRRTEQPLRLTASSVHLTENFSGLSQAQWLKWAVLFTALHCVVGRKWGSETLSRNLPYFLRNSDQWPGDSPVTSPSTDVAKWWSNWLLLFRRSPLSKVIHSTQCWNTYS